MLGAVFYCPKESKEELLLKELNKVYEPSKFEDRIYEFWMNGGYFHAEPNTEKESQKITLPDKSAIVKKPRSEMEMQIKGKTYSLRKCRFINFIGFPISVLPMPIVFFAKDRGGNMNIQRTEFVGNQCAKGFFVNRGFAVKEDSHDILLGNVLKGSPMSIIQDNQKKGKRNLERNYKYRKRQETN